MGKANATVDMAGDRATVEAMGKIYCRGNHDATLRDEDIMCPSCRNAIEVTLEHVSACPDGHAHNCADCLIHCQRGKAQEEIKRIMHYSAPRMVLRHPMMTLGYLRKRLKDK